MYSRFFAIAALASSSVSNSATASPLGLKRKNRRHCYDYWINTNWIKRVIVNELLIFLVIIPVISSSENSNINAICSWMKPIYNFINGCFVWQTSHFDGKRSVASVSSSFTSMRSIPRMIAIC